MITRLVSITAEFEAVHSWPTCPWDAVSFLRNPHRHLFKVCVKASVGHNDRGIEFIMLKRLVEGYCFDVYKGKDIGALSCEDIAEGILRFLRYGEHIPAVFCSVYEDGENGAELTWEDDHE